MAEAAVAGREKSFSTAYQWYALGVLFVVYVFNFIDRSVLALLAQSIKEDLHISDTALGLLGGLAFAVFYTGARHSDRASRRQRQSAQHPRGLFVDLERGHRAVRTRAELHVSVAGAHRRRRWRSGRQSAVALDDLRYVPATPSRHRARHLCARHSGGLDDRCARRRLDQRRVRLAHRVHDRRSARPAARGGRAPDVAGTAARRFGTGARRGRRHAADRRVFRLLWQRPSFRWLSISAGFQAFVSYGAGAWIPPMFERTHGLSSTQIGTALFWLGFAERDRHVCRRLVRRPPGRRDVRWYMWLPALTTLLVVAVPGVRYLTSDPWLAFWVMVDSERARFVLARAGVLADAGPRRLAHARGRGVDHVVRAEHHRYGAWAGLRRHPVGSAQHVYVARRESLRWSLVISLSFALIAVYCCVRGARTLKEDLGRSQEVT